MHPVTRIGHASCVAMQRIDRGLLGFGGMFSAKDEEVEADGAEAEAAFTAAEMDLYADWHQRDGMLPDPH